MVKCPGQDQRYWKPGDIFEANCPNCNTAIEFWKDEPRRKCHQCLATVWNPRLDIGCAQWCQYAEQCFGAADSEDIICQKLIAEMKSVFGQDRKRIEHSLAVLRYADEIQKVEGGNPLVIKASAVLCDIDGSDAVKAILSRQDIDAETIGLICRIIPKHNGEKELDSIESSIISDAAQLTELAEKNGNDDKDQLYERLKKTFKTGTAKQLGQKLMVKK